MIAPVSSRTRRSRIVCPAPAHAVETRLREILVLGAVSFDEEIAGLARRGQRIGAEVEHDVRDARRTKLLADAPSHAAVAADDEVVAQALDRPPPPSLSER